MLLSLLRLRQRLRRGEAVPDAIIPAPQGGVARLLAPLFRRLDKSRGMFWLGLGFDTGTEIGVPSLAAAGDTSGHAG